VTDEEVRIALAVLQTDFKHMTAAVEGLSEKLDETNKNVASINGTLSEAKGGWRTLMWVAGAAGTVGAGLSYLASLLHFPKP
jgi:hypothetical protein